MMPNLFFYDIPSGSVFPYRRHALPHCLPFGEYQTFL